MLENKPETLCRIVFRTREMAGTEELVAETADETETDVDELINEVTLADTVHGEHEHDPIYIELKEFIESLTIEEQVELIALVWLGRGDGTKDDWGDLVALARDRWNPQSSEYLLGMPLVGDYLDEALQQFEISCEDFEDPRR